MATDEEGSSTPEGGNASERLDSWKEIAAYLRREVRTVQRWEKEEGLPVHRRLRKKLGAVHAYKAEIDAWLRNGQSRLAEMEVPAAQQSLGHRPAEGGAAGNGPSHTTHAGRPSRKTRRTIFTTRLVALAAVAAVLGWLLIRSEFRTAAPTISDMHEVTPDTYWKDSMATDGVRVYYTEQMGGRMALVSAVLAGGWGVPKVLSQALAHPKILGISPNGNDLLLIDNQFGKAGPLMAMSLPESRLRKFSAALASCAAWSPDGKWVAFCGGDSIFRMQEGGAVEKLATFPANAESLAWAPDGRSVRVLSGGKPSTDTKKANAALSLWEVSVPAGKVRTLPLPPRVGDSCDASLAWSGGEKDFVLATRCVNSSEIWLLPDRASWTDGRSDWIRLDADFTRITQVVCPEGSDKLLVLNAQSGPLHLVRYDPSSQRVQPVNLGVNPVEVNYSRDGQWIAYVEYPERTLWRARADGGDALKLTFAPLRAQLPRWSPDGKTIAFSGIMPGRAWRVYLVGVNGGPVRPAAEGGQGQGAPTWSPDGQSLVFGDIEIDEPNTHFIHLLNLQTGKLTSLPDSAALRTARWSPSGRYVAALAYEERKLMLFNFQAGKWRTVAGGVHTDTLNWSGDSRYIYFDSRYEPSPGIFRFDLANRCLETVLLFGNFREGPDLNSDVAGFSLAPDGTILVNAAMQSSRIYAMTLKP